jgi:hypothetical protein
MGVLAMKTFTLAKKKLHDIASAYGDMNEGEGFTQGQGSWSLAGPPLSLVSQLSLNKLSYCLTSLDDTSESPLLLDSLATISKTADAISNP